MNKKISFKILSSDGKQYSNDIDALYIKTTSGDVGILPNHFPLVASIPISIFKIVKDNKTTFFTTSGGMLDVNFENTLILADTFEEKSELNKERLLKKKTEIENKLKSLIGNNDEEIAQSEFSLKKALNRLRLIE